MACHLSRRPCECSLWAVPPHPTHVRLGWPRIRATKGLDQDQPCLLGCPKSPSPACLPPQRGCLPFQSPAWAAQLVRAPGSGCRPPGVTWPLSTVGGSGRVAPGHSSDGSGTPTAHVCTRARTHNAGVRARPLPSWLIACLSRAGPSDAGLGSPRHGRGLAAPLRPRGEQPARRGTGISHTGSHTRACSHLLLRGSCSRSSGPTPPPCCVLPLHPPLSAHPLAFN